MNQTKSGNRVVLISRSAPASQKTVSRQPTAQRPTTYRIVVIKNGELVGNQPGR